MKRYPPILVLLISAVMAQPAKAQATRPTYPLLEELNHQTQALYAQAQQSLVQARLPMMTVAQAMRDDVFRKWSSRLDPAVRQRLEDIERRQAGDLNESGIHVHVVAPASKPGDNEIVILRPPGMPSDLRPIINQTAIVLDEQGHILLPLYLDKQTIGDGINVLTTEKHADKATFVASDQRTALTVLKLSKPAGKPAPIADDRPLDGSLVLLVSSTGSGMRLHVWTAVPPDTAIVFAMDGRIAGIDRGGQFLSGGQCLSVARQLIEHGVVKRATLGVGVRDVRADDPLRLQITALGDRPAIVVVEVLPDSVAHRAGLKSGDLILSLAGQTVGDIPSFAAAIAARQGKTSLRILRDGKEENITVVLQQQ